jgi:hypothetical protein
MVDSQPLNVTSVVLTSAVVSAVVTSILTLFGQYFERRAKEKELHFERSAKEKELLFTKCVELAQTKTEFLMKVAEKTGATATLADYAVYAEMYYWLLSSLHENGKLPDGWREESKRRYGHQM